MIVLRRGRGGGGERRGERGGGGRRRGGRGRGTGKSFHCSTFLRVCRERGWNGHERIKAKREKCLSFYSAFLKGKQLKINTQLLLQMRGVVVSNLPSIVEAILMCLVAVSQTGA